MSTSYAVPIETRKVKVITYSILILHIFFEERVDLCKIYFPPNLVDFDRMCGTVIPSK